MVEHQYIQMRGFHNLYNADNTVWGFTFRMQTRYYKGLWLSQFRAGDVIVDDVVYPKETIIWNIHGIDYTREEMYDRMDQYWQLHEPAVIKVPLPGGLSQGYHTIEVKFGWVNNYNSMLEKEYDGSGLGVAGPYMSFEADNHPTARRLLLVW